MGKQTLVLEEDWYSDEVVLIALHTHAELYKLAYCMNAVLKIQLHLQRDPVEVFREDSKLSFPLYQYEDRYQDLKFYLIGNNITRQTEEYLSNELFFDNYSTYFESLIPERREVDAFFKIDGSELETEWLSGLRQISALSAVYAVDIKTLKSYSNLIFE